MSSEQPFSSVLGSLLLLAGVLVLVIAVVLAIVTTEGWPKLTVLAMALLVFAFVLISRHIRIPS